MTQLNLWCALAVLMGITAACAQSGKSEAPAKPPDEAPLQGTVVEYELADVVLHLVDSKSNQRIETTRRVYGLFPDWESLIETAGGGLPLAMELETGRVHRVRVEARGFEPSAPITIELARGEKFREVTIPVESYAEPKATVVFTAETADGEPVYSLRVELRAVGQFGGLTRGKTEDQGNSVQLDVPADRYWCRASSPDPAAPWLPQLFELDLAGGEAHVQNIVVAEGGTVRVLLARNNTDIARFFNVATAPDKATFIHQQRRRVPRVWLDNFRGVSDSVRVATLAPGQHTIRVSVNSGGKWSRTVTVEAGKITVVDFREELGKWLESMEKLSDEATR